MSGMTSLLNDTQRLYIICPLSITKMSISLLISYFPSLQLYSKDPVSQLQAECYFFISFLLVFVASAMVQHQWNQIFNGFYLMVVGMLGANGVASAQWSLLAWWTYAVGNLTIAATCLVVLKNINSKTLRVLFLVLISLIQKNLMTETRYTVLLHKLIGQNLMLAIQIITFSLLLYEFNWVIRPCMDLLVSLLRYIFQMIHLPIELEPQFFVVLYIKVLAFLMALYRINGRFSTWHLLGQVFANVIVQDVLKKRRRAGVIEQMSVIVARQKKSYQQARKMMGAELKSTRRLMFDQLSNLQKEYEQSKPNLSEQEIAQMSAKIEVYKKHLIERHQKLTQRWRKQCESTKEKIKQLENQVKLLMQRE